MTTVVCIYLVAWGVADRLPQRLRRWVAFRSLRGVMAAQGVPVDGYTDAELEAGAHLLNRAVEDRRFDLAMAPTYRDMVRDSAATRERTQP